MASMTATQASALEQAIERATEHGVEVVAKGKRKRDGARIYFTTSHSEANHWHAVVQVGGRLVCDCTASRYGRGICTHRASVYMHLTVEAAKREALAKLSRITLEKEAAKACKAAPANKPAGWDAPLARDNRPFSIWK